MKLLSKLLLCMMLIMAVACEKDTPFDPNKPGTEDPRPGGDEPNEPGDEPGGDQPIIYKVGDFYKANGQEGIVLNVSDDGLNGTIISLTEPQQMTLFEAMDWCKSLGGGWRLPSREELTQLYQSKDLINAILESTPGATKIVDDWYWTHEITSDNEWVWTVNMTDGMCSKYIWEGLGYARAVYEFGENEYKQFQLEGQWIIEGRETSHPDAEGVSFACGFDFGYTEADTLWFFGVVTDSSLDDRYKINERYKLEAMKYSATYDNDGNITTITMISTEEASEETLDVTIVNNDNIVLSVNNDPVMTLLRVDSAPLFNLHKGDAIINFQDAKVKEICVTNWDTNSDGEISYKEAAAVKDIGKKFYARHIKYFTELQFFTGLTEIPESAFYECYYLAKVTIPGNIETIGKAAFYDCESLTNIMVPNGVKSIEKYAFAYCSSLKNVAVGETTKNIGDNAFYDCKSLEEFYCQPLTPPTLGEKVFDMPYDMGDKPIGCTIYVIESAVSTYKAAKNWSRYADYISF